MLSNIRPEATGGTTETLNLPVDTSSLPGSFAQFSVQKKDKVQPYTPDKPKVPVEVVELAKLNVSVRSLPLVALLLDFPEEESQDFLLRSQPTSAEELLSNPLCYYLIEELISTAAHEKKIPVEEIVNALQIGYENENISFTHALSCSQRLLDVGIQSGQYDSYVFLIWIKHPERPSCSALPNTINCPVKQTSYDWAISNPDKLVVLWFSSSTLVQNDHEEINDFLEAVRNAGVENFLALDLDKIDLGKNKLEKVKSEFELRITRYMLEVSDDNQKKDWNFQEYIHSLRINLLSMGHKYISSASRDEKYSIQEENIPHRGAYFDMDYLPVRFRSYSHPYKPFCRDGSFTKFEPYSILAGSPRLTLTPISMIATCNEDQSTINQLLGTNSQTYTEFNHMVTEQPYLFSQTKVFRMSDCEYKDGTMSKWDRVKTWSGTFNDADADCPLVQKKYKCPEYLLQFQENTSCTEDPMLWKVRISPQP